MSIFGEVPQAAPVAVFKTVSRFPWRSESQQGESGSRRWELRFISYIHTRAYQNIRIWMSVRASLMHALSMHTLLSSLTTVTLGLVYYKNWTHLSVLQLIAFKMSVLQIRVKYCLFSFECYDGGSHITLLQISYLESNNSISNMIYSMHDLTLNCYILNCMTCISF